MTRKIAVFGAGLVGCYVGGRLAGAARVDLTLVARSARVRELTEARLRVTDCDGADILCPPGSPEVTSDFGALAEADLILVAVKSGATDSAAEAIARHAPRGATVVSLQNGVDNIDRLLPRLPGVPVLAGMIPFNVTQPEPARFHRGTSGRIVVEDHPAISPWIDVFATAGLPLTLRGDMRSVQWGKLVINLNNAINALSGLTLADELADRNYRCVWSGAMREALTMLRAARITPAAYNGRPLGLIARILQLPNWAYDIATRLSGNGVDPLARSSMADDLRDGRLTEVDYINGAVVELARRLDLESPINIRLTNLIHAAERGAGPIGGKTLLRVTGA